MTILHADGRSHFREHHTSCGGWGAALTNSGGGCDRSVSIWARCLSIWTCSGCGKMQSLTASDTLTDSFYLFSASSVKLFFSLFASVVTKHWLMPLTPIPQLAEFMPTHEYTFLSCVGHLYICCGWCGPTAFRFIPYLYFTFLSTAIFQNKQSFSCVRCDILEL